MPTTRRRFVQMAAASTFVSAGGSADAGGQTAAAPASSPRLRARGPGEAIVVCAGDLFLMQPLSSQAHPGSAAVYQVLRDADAALANLENGLSSVGSPDLGGFRYGAALRGSPSLAPELARAGVTAVSLANNHTGNFGPDALLETMSVLDSAGVGHAGAGRTLTEAFAPRFLKAGELTIALISVYTFYYNFEANDVAGPSRAGIAACRAYDVLVGNVAGLDAARRDEPPYLLDLLDQSPHVVVAPLKEDVDRLAAAVTAARDRADFTIVSAHVHWGRHTKHDLPPHLRVVAHAAIDAGADLVVGHGPHTIRGVERYRGKPILHSLGNFVLRPPEPGAAPPPSAGPGTGERGLVARLAVTRRRVAALELLPIVTGPQGPWFPDGPLADRIVNGLYGMSAALGTDVELRDGVGLVAF